MKPAAAGGLGVLLGLLGLLAAGCTDDAVVPPPAPDDPVVEEEPDGPLGAEAVVVLPPAEGIDPEVRRDLEARVAQTDVSALERLRAVRTLTPDAAVFVGDFARALGEEGVEVVCLLGADAHAVAVEVAATYPATRYCVLPVTPAMDAGGGPETAPESPDGPAVARDAVRATVDLAVEDLGRLVGAAVRAGADDGPVGLVLSGGALPRDRFAAGLLDALGDLEVVEAEDTGAAPADQAEALLAAGATVVVVDGGSAAGEVVAALAGRLALAGPAALFDAETGPAPLVSWRVRWETAVGRAIEAALGDQPVGVRLGFADDVFRVRADPDAPGVVAALDAAAAALSAGADPLPAVPRP